MEAGHQLTDAAQAGCHGALHPITSYCPHVMGEVRASTQEQVSGYNDIQYYIYHNEVMNDKRTMVCTYMYTWYLYSHQQNIEWFNR